MPSLISRVYLHVHSRCELSECLPCRLRTLHLEKFDMLDPWLYPLRDVHLSMLAPLATTLEELSLADSRCFSQQALVHLTVLSCLTRLSLAGIAGL
jgi:hypothetical protein